MKKGILTIAGMLLTVSLVSAGTTVPVLADEGNPAIVSGCSPSILKSVLSGEVLDPVRLMLKTVNSERYAEITI